MNHNWTRKKIKRCQTLQTDTAQRNSDNCVPAHELQLNRAIKRISWFPCHKVVFPRNEMKLVDLGVKAMPVIDLCQEVRSRMPSTVGTVI